MQTKINLTNEQKLEVLKKAIEMGADIDISFHQICDAKEAYKIGNSFSQLMNTKIEERKSSTGSFLKIDGPDEWKDIDIYVFYN